MQHAVTLGYCCIGKRLTKGLVHISIIMPVQVNWIVGAVEVRAEWT